MARYAEGTTVPVSQSRAELEELMRKHGATEFVTGSTETYSVFQCRIGGLALRFRVDVPPMPPLSYKGPSGHTSMKRTPEQARKLQDAELRRRWRAQVLVAKAKLELIASGGSTLEREFMADLLLQGGSTVGDEMAPRIEEAKNAGKFPSVGRILMLGTGGG